MSLDWKDYIKSKEDYILMSSTGMMYEVFPEIKSWEECEKELEVKQEEEIGFIKSDN